VPLFPAQRYFAGRAVQLPARQRFAFWGPPPRRTAALGTRDRLAVRGSHRRVIGEILLQEPSGEFPSEGASAAFALRERHDGRLLAVVEVEIEGRACLLKPLLAELLSGGV
jgi:hypothetical protein